MSEFRAAASLLWLAGAGLRLTILAVPPVIALIQSGRLFGPDRLTHAELKAEWKARRGR